jgi:hypothetical protein
MGASKSSKDISQHNSFLINGYLMYRFCADMQTIGSSRNIETSNKNSQVAEKFPIPTNKRSAAQQRTF